MLLPLLLCSGLALPAQDDTPPPDPTVAEVPLPAAAGWNASLIVDNGETGIWTVRSAPVFEEYACPEVIGLDDEGRCLVMVSYSGKWTPVTTIEDKKWLGGLAVDDVDPRIEGVEIYTGGQLGRLYQVVPYPHGVVDNRLIAELPGKEIHTIVSGDLDPRSAGAELLVFTRPGALYRISPTGPHGSFETVKLQDLRGRVRDAVVLPSAPGDPAEIATVTRAGTVDLLRMTGEGPAWSTIHAAPMGTGRLSLSPERPGGQVVLYTGQDDGAILRHQRLGPDAWLTETIYLGPQGVRGVVAGRFSADPDAETVAVFGYSGKVQLLSRTGDGPWSAETIFVDRDKGHWLAVAEVDTRNATREIIGSGYGARIFLLSRPPGYGLEGVPTDPDPVPRPVLEEEGADEQADAGAAGASPARVAVRASADSVSELSTLSYRGGFETKTLVYETLVTRDARGALAPGLAESWRLEDGGRRVVLTLREGARWHDGTPVDADAVSQHLRRWVGLPEHAWLRSSEHVVRVGARSPREVEVELDEPWALLPDLCAINPGGVRGPGTLDREGEFVRPVGSGPFELAAVREEGRVLCYRRAGDGGEVDLVCYDDGDDPLADLLRGDLDVLADGWAEAVPRADVARLAADPRFEVQEGPGSSVVYLSFRFHDGPTASVDVRRAVRAALDREALVREVEAGFADPCTTWAAPSVTLWPSPAEAPFDGSAPLLDTPLRIVVSAGAEKDGALAAGVAAQLSRAGLPAVVVALEAPQLAQALGEGEFDVRLERTWGVPYDPYISLTARFLSPTGAPTAASERFFGVDPVLAELAGRIARTPEESDRVLLYTAFQARIDEAASIVPLYARRRLAVVRSGLGPLVLDHDLYRFDLTVLART